MRNLELIAAFILFLLPILTHGYSSQFNQSLDQIKMHTGPSNQHTGFLRYAIHGSLHEGLFVAILRTGQPPRDYHFDIDTGSDISWIQCAGQAAHRAPNPPYTPHNNFVPQAGEVSITYADDGHFVGRMVVDHFHSYDTINRRHVTPALVFGCGIFTKHGEHGRRKFDGILALGKSEISFPSQLKHQGLTQNVHGHCLSRHGRGFGFFGLDRALSANAVWLRLKQTPNHYVVGPATLSLDHGPHRINNIDIILDTGSTYTYFNPTVYEPLYDMVLDSLSRTPLSLDHEDPEFPLCWKLNGRDITNIDHVRRYFKPIVLEFAGGRMIALQPEDYLLISPENHFCFGILNDEHLGDMNILGDISMIDKLVIYDNERGLVGWNSVPSCSQLWYDFCPVHN